MGVGPPGIILFVPEPGTSIRSRALPGPGLWGGGWGHRVGPPGGSYAVYAWDIMGGPSLDAWYGVGPPDKRYNLKRYAIITWDIVRFILTQDMVAINWAYYYAQFSLTYWDKLFSNYLS